MRLLALAVTFTTAVCNTASSAEISTSDHPRCAVDLVGPISDGDAAEFKKLILTLNMDYREDSGAEGNNPDHDALCLNSPGGNYLEGRNIAIMTHEFGIPTRILGEASCHSACAFIFMAGRSLGAEWDSPYRALSTGGTLSFHAPYTTFAKDEMVSGELVKTLVTFQNMVVSDLIMFGSYQSIFDSKPAFSPVLLGKLLGTGPDEMLRVRTIQDIERWNIILEDYDVEAEFSKKTLSNICKNFQAWQIDRDSDSGASDYIAPVSVVKLPADDGSEQQLFRIDTGGMAERFCLIEMKATPGQHYVVCSKDDFSGVHFGDCPNYGFLVPGYYALPADTPIASPALH